VKLSARGASTFATVMASQSGGLTAREHIEIKLGWISNKHQLYTRTCVSY